jgi:transcriptional regulator with XRE-family HTH domain
VDTRDTNLRREALVGFALPGHPFSEKSHAQNVRSSYTTGQAACTMSGWPPCTLLVQALAMSAQGELLRQWRERVGLTLEQAADAVDVIALSRGIDKKGRRVPRTHASLSRWETGVVDTKELGLELIAAAYGVSVEDLRRPPPQEGARAVRQVEVPADHADMVAAFIEALERKAG